MGLMGETEQQRTRIEAVRPVGEGVIPLSSPSCWNAGSEKQLTFIGVSLRAWHSKHFVSLAHFTLTKTS